MAEGLGAQAQITLDISSDMQHLHQLQLISQTPIGQDSMVMRDLRNASLAMAQLIASKLGKQRDLIESAMVGSLKQVLQDGGSGLGGS